MDYEKILKVNDLIRTNYELGAKLGSYSFYNEDVFKDLLLVAKKIHPSLKLTKEEEKELKRRADSEFQIFQPDGNALLGDYEHEYNWYTLRKEFIDEKYWPRYRTHLFNQKWSTEILNKLENDTLNNLMNYLGDPVSEDTFSRKGLVMGDVQSGKTSNYIGLICKAADAGYKVIILLTGVLETLRKQTQVRVEEGFIGYDAENLTWVGVGKNESSDIPIPKSLTSRAKDFTGTTGENTFLRFENDTAPFIFITKKNVNTLKKIRETITNLNIIPPATNIDTSLLVIDDEADNASVNTNDQRYDPTSINSEIRKILNLFTRSSYVGFTATPFANVFIDPDSETEMLKGDLFPNDFIYSLNPPSNYFGANKMFINKEYDTVQIIDDNDDSFPLKHKKEWSGNSIFPSLVEAINCFFVANAIRDLNEKNEKNSHRTMLINVSRFINVQQKIYEIVSNLISNIKNAIRYNYNLDFSIAVKSPYIKSLKEAYDKHYSNNYNWKDIFKTLYDSTKNIVVYRVPNKHKDPYYEKYSDEGLRCIVIGGLALSRGLTLEGLTISYLYRSTATFDVLMQMGRWFGYRDRPEDYSKICKIWMLNSTKNYFEEITKAINNLKEDIYRLQLSKETPKEFGIRVRNESDELGITDRNKMRYSKKIVYTDDLFGKVLETPFISGDLNDIKNNMSFIHSFFEDKIPKHYGGNLFYESISSNEILCFLDKFNIHEANRITYFEKDKISNFIKEYSFEYFDIIIIGIQNGLRNTKISNKKVNLSERQFDLLEDLTIRVGGKRRRLGGPEDTKLPTQKRIQRAINTTYLYEGRNPLLLIYPLSLKKIDANQEKGISVTPEEEIKINLMVERFNENDLVPYGVGIGFPKNSEYSSKKIKVFYINDRTKWWNIMNIKDNEEDE